jgi:hypothetical protein
MNEQMRKRKKEGRRERGEHTYVTAVSTHNKKYFPILCNSFRLVCHS